MPKAKPARESSARHAAALFLASIPRWWSQNQRTHAHTGKMPDKPASHRPSAVDTAVRKVVKESGVSPTLEIAADHGVGHAPAPTRDVLARLGPGSHANRKLLGMNPLPKRSILRQLFLDESQLEADEEKLQIHFNSIDMNRDGSLDKAELKTALHELGDHKTDAEVDELYEELDLDGNGRIDFAEFCRAVKSPCAIEKWLSGLPFARVLARRVRVDLGRDAKETAKDNPYAVISHLTCEHLDEAVDAFVPEIKRLLRSRLERMQACFKDADKTRSAHPEQGQNKFGFFNLKQGESVGGIADFNLGVEARIGNPQSNLRKGMEDEHCAKRDWIEKDRTFKTTNYAVKTCSEDEWNVVVNNAKPKTTVKKRRVRPIHDLMSSEETKQVVGPVACGTCSECKACEGQDMSPQKCLNNNELTEEEVIAVALYTGPMFMLYNAALRQAPVHIYNLLKFTKADGSEGTNCFPSTISALVSAVLKIQRKVPLPEGLVLYRGLGRACLPPEFYSANKHGIKGVAEFGFMSTTRKKSVAIDYSGIKHGNPVASVLSMTTGAVDRAASLQLLSQFPEEEEYLWVPMSFLEPARESPEQLEVTEDGPVRVIPVRTNANLKTSTVEELQRKRKHMLVDALEFHQHDLDRILEEMSISDLAQERQRLLALTADKSSVRDVVQYVREEYAKIGTGYRDKQAEWYNDDSHYRSAMNDILEMKTMAIQALEKFLAGREGATMSKTMNLRRAARKWRRDVESRMRSLHLDGDSKQSQALAKVLCNCEGLTDHTDDPKGQRPTPAKNESGETPLFTAAANGNVLQVELLLMGGAIVRDAIDNDGFTALMAASELGHTEICSLLLEHKADVNRCVVGSAPPNQTAIYMAAREGQSKCLKLLLDVQGADANHRTGKENTGQSALSAVATLPFTEGRVSCVKLLLDAGADIEAPGLRGLPALWWAISSLNIEVLRTLLQSRKDLANVKLTAKDAGVINDTPLNFALNKHLQTPKTVEKQETMMALLEELIMAGANVNERGGLDDDSPLLHASKAGNTECVDRLLKEGACVTMVNKKKWNALHCIFDEQKECRVDCAAWGGDHVACVKLLLDANCSASQDNNKGKTPLEMADAAMKQDYSPETTEVGRLLKEAQPLIQSPSGNRYMTEQPAPGEPGLPTIQNS